MGSPERVNPARRRAPLRLDFEFLESMPGGIDQVRLWWATCWVVMGRHLLQPAVHVSLRRYGGLDD